MVVLGEICKRCKKEPTVLVSRKDTFCANCFVRFIRGKQRKQMQDDKFKVKFNDNYVRPRILLDMQNDHQSYVLLDILISMLTEQLSQGPKAIRGFDLIVFVIVDKLSQYFVDIEKIREFYGAIELERLGIQFLDIDIDTFVTNNAIENLKLDLQHFQTFLLSDNTNGRVNSYKSLLSQISDKSTKEDICQIIHKDMIIQAAKDSNCSIVIESHSMTSLAVDILSDTIRGRGSEIPHELQDKYIGTFDVIHPLRDVLNSEIKMYARTCSLEDLSPILKIESSASDISTKNKSVKNMVTEYFQTLEVEYPEVVSTVVKIGAKLANPSNQVTDRCEICKVPIYHDPKQWLEQITVDGYVKPQTEEEESNLQRYLESLGLKDDEVDNADEHTQQVNLCYGCMVTLGVSDVKHFQWPHRPTREEILAEYIIDDDDNDESANNSK